MSTRDPDPERASLDPVELYRARIMDHARAPRHFGKLAAATHRATGYNPLCGDQLTLELECAPGEHGEHGEHIRAVAFEGAGCALSMASASLMTVAIEGKTLAEARAIRETLLRLLTRPDALGDARDEPGVEALGEVAALSSVRAFPARLKCVTLAWLTLASALDARPEPVSSE